MSIDYSSYIGFGYLRDDLDFSNVPEDKEDEVCEYRRSLDCFSSEPEEFYGEILEYVDCGECTPLSLLSLSQESSELHERIDNFLLSRGVKITGEPKIYLMGCVW